MADLLPEELNYFVSVLENEESSPALRNIASHVFQTYIKSGGGSTGLKEAGRELTKIRARTDMGAMADYVLGLPPAAHHRIIMDAIQDPSRKRLCIVAPPGTAKSTLVSLELVLYEMGKNPNSSIIMLSSAFSQVEKWGTQLRPILEGTGPAGQRYKEIFPEVEPDLANWTKEKLYLSNRTEPIPYPNLMLAGMGSKAILGTRADLIILDDVTSPQQAKSPAELAKQRQDLGETVMSRLYTDGRVIAIMTRWHSNDLVPTLVNKYNFELIHMPAMVEDDPRGCYVDFVPSLAHLVYPEEGSRLTEPEWVLHPDPDAWEEKQLTREYIQAKRQGYEVEVAETHAVGKRRCVRKFIHKDGSPTIWPENKGVGTYKQIQAQAPLSFRLVYQGDPTSNDGDVYKESDFLFYGENEDNVFKRVPIKSRWYITIDVATGTAKQKGGGDYFVLLVVAVDEYGNKFIVDHFRDNRLPTTDQPEKVREYYQKYPQVQGILIETTNYQVALFNQLVKEHLPCVEVKPFKDKLTRLEAGAIFYKNHTVFLPEESDWTETFIKEHTDFPKGKNDDQIDAATQLFEWLSFNTQEPTEVEVTWG